LLNTFAADITACVHFPSRNLVELVQHHDPLLGGFGIVIGFNEKALNA
jgi:hypothetical protein